VLTGRVLIGGAGASELTGAVLIGPDEPVPTC
jgi:hypothetical protein